MLAQRLWRCANITPTLSERLLITRKVRYLEISPQYHSASSSLDVSAGSGGGGMTGGYGPVGVDGWSGV